MTRCRLTLAAFGLAALGLAVTAQPADASLFCTVLKSPDGFVALREKPDAGARIVERMRADDEVQALEGRRGRWQEVLHWRGDARYHEATRGNTRKGWVHMRYISECG